jgi:hypothetical protein
VIFRTILDLTVLKIAFPFSEDPCCVTMSDEGR